MKMDKVVSIKLTLTRQEFLDWYIVYARYCDIASNSTRENRALELMRDQFTEDYTAPNRKDGKWIGGERSYKLTKFKTTTLTKKKGK